MSNRRKARGLGSTSPRCPHCAEVTPPAVYASGAAHHAPGCPVVASARASTGAAVESGETQEQLLAGLDPIMRRLRRILRCPECGAPLGPLFRRPDGAVDAVLDHRPGCRTINPLQP